MSFAEAEEAVLCATAIQRSLRDEPIPVDDAGTPLAIRIGMHTGRAELVQREGRDDYDGHAVNIAARVESLLKGGERVYCSGETATLAKNTPGVRFHSYGGYALKGLSAPVEIFDALWDDAMQPEPPPQAHERLPYPWLTPWIGRRDEMKELADALAASRLVTLHGIGGVGKTRLAVETVLARSGEVVFVSLERASDLLIGVREALGLTEVDAPDFEALCRHLHGGDRLLLLDNFESVAASSSLLPRLATTPGVRVLVTSQQVLNVVGEQVVDLYPLRTAESARLFTGLAQQRDARWQPDDDAAMRDVLAATDGLPYLIELVAAVAPRRRLRQLADELKTHVTEVRVRGKDAVRPDRHAGVQACLEWATGRLPAEEREALSRLAIFSGGFDAEAADSVAATSLESLDVLVDASLLRFDRETGRYSMLPTTRQFALERLGSSDLAARHARWFIEHLERAARALQARGGEAQATARRWIDAEWENVQQAVAWAEKEELDLFSSAVPALGVYLRRSCRFSEDVRLNEALIGRLSHETAPADWAVTQNNLGNAYLHLPTGDRAQNLRKAIACYEAALRVWTKRDDGARWAMVQNNFGIVYSDMPRDDQGGNLKKAIACYKAALRVRTDRDFPAAWASTQNNLGTAYVDLPKGDRGENLRKATACYEAALRVFTETDFPADWAMIQNNLGIAYQDIPTGLTKAIVCYEAALRVWTEHGFPANWANTQNNLGIAYRNLPTGDRSENLRKAIACYEAALRVRTERDFPGHWAETQYNLGNVYEDLAAREQAILCFESAARGYAAVGLTENAEDARQRAATLKSTT